MIRRDFLKATAALIAYAIGPKPAWATAIEPRPRPWQSTVVDRVRDAILDLVDEHGKFELPPAPDMTDLAREIHKLRPEYSEVAIIAIQEDPDDPFVVIHEGGRFPDAEKMIRARVRFIDRAGLKYGFVITITESAWRYRIAGRAKP